MNDNLVTGIEQWQELTAAPADNLIATLAEAARRHRVFVSITVSPHDSDPDDSDPDDE